MPSENGKQQEEPHTMLQAAGHAGTLKESANHNYILKPYDKQEEANYEVLWKSSEDSLQKVVAHWGGSTEMGIGSADSGETEKMMRLSNLLEPFDQPCVMDCKMGCRTFQEKEAKNATLREDLYTRLKELTPEYLTEADHKAGAITKFKWMSSRDAASTSGPLGFRVDGIVSQQGARIPKKELNLFTKREEVIQALPRLLPVQSGGAEGNQADRAALVRQIVEELEKCREAMEQSDFFKSHEFVGASLLFVCDEKRAQVHFIDFAKTVVLPDGVNLTHRGEWQMGNHEDSVLRGVDNLLSCWKTVLHGLEQSSPSNTIDDIQIEELESLLEKHDIDIASWGTGGAKSLKELYTEIHDERAVTFETADDGRFIRVMDVVKAWVLADLGDRGTFVLFEPKKHNKFTEDADGQSAPAADKPKGKPLQTKVQHSVKWQDALTEAMEEKLNIDREAQESALDIRWNTYQMRIDGPRLGTENDGYLGLWSKYRIHEVDIVIKDPQNSLFSRLGLPDAVDFTTMQGAGLHSAFGHRQHRWSWLPASSAGYVARTTSSGCAA